MNRKTNTLFLIQFSVLLALEALFCFTPLGSLPALGPIVATLAMIPVVITAILLGTKAGTLMGFITGLFSLIVWTFTPPSPIMAFIFTPFYSVGEVSGNVGSLIICFVPRILTGTMAALIYNAMQKRSPHKTTFNMAVAAAVASLTNTFGVMLGIAAFFGDAYSSLAGGAMLYIIGITVLTSGLPEAAVSALVAPAVCRPLKIIMNKNI